MFIAMNRFKVTKGCEAAFEQVWLSRDSHLDKVRGFVEFHLLKGPEADDHTLYASHTLWQNRATFEAWTKSEAFRAAHEKAGDNKPHVAFIANLMEAGVDFVAVDMPHANKLTIHILSAVAEHERVMISQRTRAALAAAKSRGVRLGNRSNIEVAQDRSRAARMAQAD